MWLHTVSYRKLERTGQHLPREDGSINNMNVVSTVDLSVQIDNGSSASESTIGSDLGCTNPVVGAAGRGCLWQTGNILFNGLVGGRDLELDSRVLLDSCHHALDASNDGTSVGIVLEVRGLAHEDAERAVDGKRTAGCGSSA
jgi:hypothetical protein